MLSPRVPKARFAAGRACVVCGDVPWPLVSLVLFLEFTLAVGLPVLELLGRHPALLSQISHLLSNLLHTIQSPLGLHTFYKSMEKGHHFLRLGAAQDC